MGHIDHIIDSGSDHLRLMLATGEIGVWELDRRSGKAWRNLRHDQIFGYEKLLPEWTYAMFLEHVVDDDRAAVDALYTAALKNQTAWSFECRILRRDGEERWISARGMPLRDAGGETEKLIGHVIDITHNKQNEDRLRLLTNELNHRVRNMLAVIGAMVGLSAKTADTPEQLEQAIQGRLASLARTHDIFMQAERRAIPIAQIIRRELAPYPGAAERMNLLAPDTVTVSGKCAESLTLVVHELVTNAIKYGALSVPEGAIDIEVTHAADDRTRLIWREKGGPPVAPPRRAGFGSRLLASALGEDGKVDTDYRHDGLVCTIELTTKRGGG